MPAVDDEPGHAGPAAELRALALLALDRLDPLLARLHETAPERSCTGCPVCAALTAVRGERPELAGRLAAHATGLAAAVREALDEPPAPADPPPSRPVQHIPVERVPRDAAGQGGARC